MYLRLPRQQAGYALILMVLGLMGVGGIVLSSFTQEAKQEVDQQRYLRNQQVLEEAKQALLMYAYRYPQVFGPNRGPGRLPCPDTDNDGDANTFFNCENGGALVGRFPWRANGMEFHDARDAHGERLWYAVSGSFAHSQPLPDMVNSDSVGSITIHDQDGQRLYDGSLNGIAAVIIAPGPPIDRAGVLQDRSVANADDPEDTVADTDPGIVDPTRYLDLFGALDNADFINDDANNGFVLGPVDDLAASELIVNDQFMLVTTEEVVAMAEKATLQAYREAIEVYMANTGVNAYPWLENYDSDGLLTTYDAQVNPPVAPTPIVGRVPSTFERYFFTDADSNDSAPIISEITLKYTIDGEQFESRVPASVAPDVFFRANGNLVVPGISSVTVTGWAWDGSPTQVPTFAVDGIFEACPYVTGTEEDCNQDAGGNFIGGVTSPMWLTTREYTIDFNIMTEFPFAERTATAVNYVPPSATSHGYIEAEYDGPAYITNITWTEDEEFQDVHDETPFPNNGNLIYSAGDTVTVGVRYYPELPRWIQSNGWHDMMQAAYANSLSPAVAAANCTVGFDCLTLQGIGGTSNDKRALLILSGSNGDLDPTNVHLVDGGVDNGPPTIGAPEFFSDELSLIFEDENTDLDLVFDNRPNTNPANDVILVLE